MKLYKEQLGHAMKQKRLYKGCEKRHPRFQTVERNALKLLQFSPSYYRPALKPGQPNIREL